jgi:cryptochrome
MEDVSKSIAELQPLSQLYVLRGSPMEVLPKFFKACQITHLSFEKDDDEYTIRRDAEITELAKQAGVEVFAVHGHTMFEGEKVIKQNKGKVPITYAQYEKAASALGNPPKPLPRPTTLPPPGDIDFTTPFLEAPDVQEFRDRDVNYRNRLEGVTDYTYESIAGPGSTFSVPTMEELAMQPASSNIRGGETRALEVLEDWMTVRKQEAIYFEKPKTSPAAFKPAESKSLCVRMIITANAVHL